MSSPAPLEDYCDFDDCLENDAVTCSKKDIFSKDSEGNMDFLCKEEEVEENFNFSDLLFNFRESCATDTFNPVLTNKLQDHGSVPFNSVWHTIDGLHGKSCFEILYSDVCEGLWNKGKTRRIQSVPNIQFTLKCVPSIMSA